MTDAVRIERETKMSALQENLGAIRNVLGWNSTTFGYKIGVTGQTINNLIRKRTPMSWTQYIAIHVVIADELERGIQNEANAIAVRYFMGEDFPIARYTVT